MAGFGSIAVTAQKPTGGGTVATSSLLGGRPSATAGAPNLTGILGQLVGSSPSPSSSASGPSGSTPGGGLTPEQLRAINSGVAGRPVVAPTPAASGAPTAPASSGVMTTAAPNPVSNEIIDTLRKRANGDMGLPAELDRSIQDIRDRASEGIAGEQALSRARRGVSGSGIDKWDADQLASAQRSDINRITTDMAIGRERDRDSLLANIAGLGLSQGGQQLAQSQLALQQQAQADARASDAWQREASAAALATSQHAANLQALVNLLT